MEMFSLGKVFIQLRHLNDQSFHHENRLIMGGKVGGGGGGVLFLKFNCLCMLNLEVVSFKVFDQNSFQQYYFSEHLSVVAPYFSYSCIFEKKR